MSSEVIFTSRALSLEEAKNLSEEEQEILCIEEDDLSSYIVGNIRTGDKDYKIIHGFPGDNPVGIIYGEKREIVGEGRDHDSSSELVKWYLTVTKEVCEFGPEWEY